MIIPLIKTMNQEDLILMYEKIADDMLGNYGKGSQQREYFLFRISRLPNYNVMKAEKELNVNYAVGTSC